MTSMTRLLVTAFLLAATPLVASANSGTTASTAQDLMTDLPEANDRSTLQLIGRIEAPEGYDSISKSSSLSTPKPLTQMTLQEVLDFQRLMLRKGASSTAIGRYQFIRGTLAGMIKLHDLDRNALFDRTMQDNLARLIMEDCGFYDEDVSDTKVGNCLARTWAALPVLSGKKRGKSYYHGQGGNRARVSANVVLAALDDRFLIEEENLRLEPGAKQKPVNRASPAL